MVSMRYRYRYLPKEVGVMFALGVWLVYFGIPQLRWGR